MAVSNGSNHLHWKTWARCTDTPGKWWRPGGRADYKLNAWCLRWHLRNSCPRCRARHLVFTVDKCYGALDHCEWAVSDQATASVPAASGADRNAMFARYQTALWLRCLFSRLG